MTGTQTPSGADSSTAPDGTTPTSPADLGGIFDAAQADVAEAAKAATKAAKDRGDDVTVPDDGRVDELAEGAPVYDDRGNVRPPGTKGAKPMTFDQRAALARRQDRGGKVPEDGEPAVRKAAAQAAKSTTKAPARTTRRRR